MPNWIDTLQAREAGEADGFHDHNASTDERAAAEDADGINARAVGEGVTAGAADESYDDWTVAELQAELEDRGLSKQGNKAELVARLTEADEAE